MKTLRPMLLAALVLSGCGAPYVLEPVANGGKTVQLGEREALSASKEGVTVAVAFVGRSGRHLVFRVAVTNASAGPVEFDPATARCSSEEWAAPARAIEPEKMAAQARKMIIAEKAHYERQKSAAAFDDLLSLVDTFASPSKDQSMEEYRREQVAERSTDQSRADARRRHEANVAAFTAAEKYWKETALHKSTLKPGGRAEGTVHFPMPKKRAASVVLDFGAGKRKFQYKFAQPEKSR